MSDIPRPHRLARREEYLKRQAMQLDALCSVIGGAIDAGVMTATPEWERWQFEVAAIKAAHPKPVA